MPLRNKIQIMHTIPQTDTRIGVTISEAMRRHLKSEAARLDKDMGTVIEEALTKHIGPAPDLPADPGNGKAA